MNRLGRETSPYLLQHADNPVDWRPWGEQALACARAEDRPILLSIGYSSCHWCHVMARESFADRATAAVMNARFVNIKVDREERPDVDGVYQLAHRMLTGSAGGWPLTAFLDAETLLPFFSGTYFPRQPRYGLPGFEDLLRRMADGYASRREQVAEQGRKLSGALARLDAIEPPADAHPEKLLKAAREGLADLYDEAEGGFGQAPKFPMPAALERLLRHWARRAAPVAQAAPKRLRLVSGVGARPRGPDQQALRQQALQMVLATLTKMARGGIFDHIGGGFFRYATDRRWAIPHFEKTLYDNGVLLAAYGDALRLGPDALFRDAAAGTAEWIMREMQHPLGGYYAAQDADSEGEEGAFYLWRRDAVKRLLTEDEHLVVETLYGLDKPANLKGKWHLRRWDAWRAVVERLYLSPERADELLASAKAKLFAARGARVAPATDRKVLASWNGLAIGGMARAGVCLGETAWVESAARAAEFVRTRLVEDGRLRAGWTDGALGPAALLDDHANLLAGALALLQARWRDAEFAWALFLGDELLRRFQDERTGGFFFTPHDHERLIHRAKPVGDDAPPAGNPTAIAALVGLGHLAAAPKYLEAAERAARWAQGFAARHPPSHCALLTAVEQTLHPPELVIVRGPRQAIDEWLAAARAGYRPERATYGIPADAHHAPPHLPRLVPAEDRQRPTAFLCRGLECSAPIRDLEEFKKALA